MNVSELERTTIVKVLLASQGQYVDEAASVWARATAARDGERKVAPLEQSRPIIQGVLDISARSVLLVAVEPGIESSVSWLRDLFRRTR